MSDRVVFLQPTFLTPPQTESSPLNHTTQALTLGVNYDDSGQLITDLAYADDVVIFADLLDTLKDALYPMNNPKSWGYMSTGPIPSFNPSAHGYPLHHQHSSEHNLSQRLTTSRTLTAPSPVTRALLRLERTMNLLCH